MTTIKYKKLVRRDKIPEIIEASDKRCVCSTISKEIPHNMAAHSQRDLLRVADDTFSEAKQVL